MHKLIDVTVSKGKGECVNKFGVLKGHILKIAFSTTDSIAFWIPHLC